MRFDQMRGLVTPPLIAETARHFKRVATRPSVVRRLEGQDKLHLACGDNVLRGWANIDLESKGVVIGWNLTDGLPVPSGSIEYVFCEHFIEHITLSQATMLLADCHRVLRPGGKLRLSTPDLLKVIEEYEAGRMDEWRDVGWVPATPCQLVNGAFRLWSHEFVYDTDELRRILAQAGFRDVTQVAWRESTSPALRGLECRPFHGEIILEAAR
jgi:predicted SAM-dependent methyltransferase